MDQHGECPISAFQIELWNAKDLASNLDAVANLRISVFREFPYLYEGSLEYERKYLQVYLNSPRSVFVIAKDDRRVIGASSAIPLTDEANYVKEPFVNAGLDLNKIFYFGESVLLPQYRRQGLGNTFFNEREKAALNYTQYDKTCFCAVDRPTDHALKPAGYKPLNEFWQKRGYIIQPQLKSYFSWQDINEENETLKPMTYWMKQWS